MNFLNKNRQFLKAKSEVVSLDTSADTLATINNEQLCYTIWSASELPRLIFRHEQGCLHPQQIHAQVLKMECGPPLPVISVYISLTHNAIQREHRLKIVEN